MDAETHLVLFDADRIKDFVFATGRLKEIRGGSQLVKDASDAERLKDGLGLTEDEIIFAEGGAGVLQFTERERAEEKARALERFYRTVTRGATLTAVVQSGASFQEAKQIGDRRLRMAKEDRRRRWQTAHSPFSRACNSCGTRPAVERYTVTPGDEWLCDWCFVKRTTSDKATAGKMGKPSSADPAAGPDEVGWRAEFLQSLSEEDVHIWRNAALPETTDELAELSTPGNYMGFLYADGNGMGSQLASKETSTEYRRFSRLISLSLRRALWLALQRQFAEPVGGKLPFEVIALGGDDLILLCTADAVLPLAVTLSRLFTGISTRLQDEEEIDEPAVQKAGQEALHDLETDNHLNGPLTLSCAAIIAHPKQPILNIEEQSRQLLSSAKRAYPNQAAMDFHIVSSPVLRNVGLVRNEEYQLDNDTRLTARPLSLAEMDTLLKHVGRIKGGGEGESLPRNKLNALYQALFAGQEAAAFESFFLYYRMTPGQRQRLDQLFASFGIHTPPTAAGSGMPWGTRKRNQRDDGTFTVLADLAELYEFVEPVHEGPSENTLT